MKTEVSGTHRVVGNKRFVRVTSLLAAVGASDYSSIPSKDRDFWMARGKEKHLMFEHIEQGLGDKFTYDPRVEVFRPAHANFLRDTGFVAIKGGIEKLVKATWEELGMAPARDGEEVGIIGQMDRLGMMQGRLCLLDYKGSYIPASTAAQTSLYLTILLRLPGFANHSFRTIARYGVAFLPKGKYRMSKKYPSSDRAECLRLIHEYRSRFYA